MIATPQHIAAAYIRMRGGKPVCPPELDVNLFILRVGGRGVGGDVAVQELFRGSASVGVAMVCRGCPDGVARVSRWCGDGVPMVW